MKVQEIKKKWGNQEFTFEDLTALLKTEEWSKALHLILRNTEQKDRIRIVSQMFVKSKYKAYNMAMDRFNAHITKYLEDDRKALKEYKDLLDKEARDIPNTMKTDLFSYIRANIINDGLKNKSEYTFYAIKGLCSEDQDVNTYSSDPGIEYRPYICEFAVNKWPEHKGLKVFFGNR